MPVLDEASRRSLEAEFQRGFSPLEVWTGWGLLEFEFRIAGYEASRIPRAELDWPGAMTTISTHRRDLQRAGVKLDDWTPSPPPPEAPRRYFRSVQEMIERKSELEKARGELPGGPEGEKQQGLLDRKIARLKALIDDFSL
jgi:hypothetical protein